MRHDFTAWDRPEPGMRPDIVGVRKREDGSTEYLMHNEALNQPYYLAGDGHCNHPEE